MEPVGHNRFSRREYNEDHINLIVLKLDSIPLALNTMNKLKPFPNIVLRNTENHSGTTE